MHVERDRSALTGAVEAARHAISVDVADVVEADPVRLASAAARAVARTSAYVSPNRPYAEGPSVSSKVRDCG